MRKFIAPILLSLVCLLNADFAFRHREDPYSTHQPILYEIAMHTNGPIIEFGCGNGSTDLLHEICREQKRLLISLDDNLEWLNKFKKKYNSEWHKFYFVPGKKDNIDPSHWVTFIKNSPFIMSLTYSLCFIDQSPWLARYETIKFFKNKAQYIILHDCNYFPEQKIFGKVITPLLREKRIAGQFDFSDTFKFSKVYFPPHPWPANTGPPTLLASDFVSEFPDINWRNY